MPTYEFSCPDGHKVERIFRMATKPDGIACPDCDLQMKQVPNMAQAPRPHRFGTNKWVHVQSERTDRWYSYECASGHFTDDRFEEAPDQVPCEDEDCKLMAPRALGNGVETFWLEKEREGGYYDRTLGVQIYNEAQRKAEAKKRGLTIVDGDFDIGRETLEGRQAQEELQVGYRDYFERVHSDPAYADARKAMDRGELPSMINPDTVR